MLSFNTYNSLGQRVENITPGSTTDEAYGAGDNLLLRYTGDSNSRSFVPFGGGLLAEYFCGGMVFDHPDEIGSATTATDCTGNNIQERLYYPFGEFWTGVNPDNLGVHQEFAQLPDYDPETETGLYNTANRHYSPTGRIRLWVTATTRRATCWMPTRAPPAIPTPTLTTRKAKWFRRWRALTPTPTMAMASG
ncbi:MAG: hypothetical protein ACLQVL_13835 [Terriglobia bacterium]